VAPSLNKCCHGYVFLPSLFVAGVDAAVSNIKVFSFTMEMQKNKKIK